MVRHPRHLTCSGLKANQPRAPSGSMDFLSSFSWDWSLVKGKLGCRPGAFILYFGCRYMGILSVVTTVVFLDTFPAVFLDVSPILTPLLARL